MMNGLAARGGRLMWLTWVFTVDSANDSRSPISRLLAVGADRRGPAALPAAG